MTWRLLLLGLVVVFLGEAHAIYVARPGPGVSTVVDQVAGQPLPFVVASLNANDANPDSAADATHLVTVWEVQYAGEPVRLQYAYTTDGRTWRNYPVPFQLADDLTQPRVQAVGVDTFELTMRVAGDCHPLRMELNFQAGMTEPQWSYARVLPCPTTLHLPLLMRGRGGTHIGQEAQP